MECFLISYKKKKLTNVHRLVTFFFCSIFAVCLFVKYDRSQLSFLCSMHLSINIGVTFIDIDTVTREGNKFHMRHSFLSRQNTFPDSRKKLIKALVDATGID